MADNQATGRLLTMAEALAFLRISRATFYRQRREGGALVGIGRKLGAQWRFTQAELDRIGGAQAA